MLVYDPRDSRVHLLDPTTGCVLDLLGQGRATFDDVTDQLAIHLDIARDPALVTLALDELRRIGLLDETVESTTLLPEVNRRELIKNLALTGAAAFLIPTVATLTATRGYAQSSQFSVVGSPCAANNECTSTYCCGGMCSATPCGTTGACEGCQTTAQCAGNNTCNFGNCGQGNDLGKAANGVPCPGGNGTCCSNHCNDLGICAPKP